MKRTARLALLCAVILLLTAGSVQAAFIAATWDDDRIHILDDNLASTRFFAAGAANPNGVTTDGNLIYSGHFSSQEVVAYDFAGNEQFRWSATLSQLQGMTLVGEELAISRAGHIEFRNPSTGALVRSVFGTDITTTIEGLAYDGTAIWALGNELIAIDPLTGSTIRKIPNAARYQPFGGTGIATMGDDSLALASNSGTFYVVSKDDGSILDSGTNGLDMFGLDKVPSAGPTVPEPFSVAVWGGLGAAGMVVSVVRRKKRKAA